MISTLSNPDEKLYIFSDGGIKDCKGSFGVALGTSSVELLSIEGPVSGVSEHSNSLRSKAYGIMAAFNFLSMITRVYNIAFPTRRNIYAYCDNLSLDLWVKKVILRETFSRMFIRSESDIVLQIFQDLNQLHMINCHIILKHVKGHQDAFILYEALLQEAQLNVVADQYATNFLRKGTFPSYYMKNFLVIMLVCT